MFILLWPPVKSLGGPAVLRIADLSWLNLRLVFNYASNFIQAWLVFSQAFDTECYSLVKIFHLSIYVHYKYVLNIVFLLLILRSSSAQVLVHHLSNMGRYE